MGSFLSIVVYAPDIALLGHENAIDRFSFSIVGATASALCPERPGTLLSF
jgi:hypothetical protein